MKPSTEWRVLRSTLLHRLLAVYLLFALWVGAIAFRLVQLQILDHAEFRITSEQQRIGFVELSPRRGDILDRRLDALAITVRVNSVFAHPGEISDPLATARALEPILRQDESDLYHKLSSSRPFVYLARKLSPRVSEQVRTLDLAGIYLQEEPKRVYPGRELAAHVLGFVGLDNEGLSGLEYRYNDLIKGRKTRVHLSLDAKRKSYERDPGPRQSDGHVIVLNIDRTLQYIVEEVLEETITQTRARNGSAIIMDPHSGEILAMASHPTFNPNRYSDYTPEQRRNRSILDIYEPGSTFKILTFAAVLEERLADPSERIDCTVGTVRLASKVYREAERSFGVLSLNEVLAKSSNVGTIKLGLRLGNQTLYDYITLLGFGSRTGVDLPGEQAGLLRPPSQWSRISIGALSIGQEIGVTPLQLLRGMCALANGGHLVTPQVVRRILTPQGDLVYEPRPKRVRVLSAGTAALMKRALAAVVEEGTGESSRLSGYSSAVKTGTAQKFIDGSYSTERYVASLAGYAPLENPRLAAIVIINEPSGEYYGGHVAGPAFKQIMERSLTQLRVPRDRPKDSGPRPELVAGRRHSIEERGLPLEALEQTVLTLMGEEPAPQSETTLTFETNTFPLPDFGGQSLRDVARECARLGLRLKVAGSGVAVGQRPAPASEVSKGTVCEVFFSTNANHAASGTAGGSGGRLSQGGSESGP